MEVVATADLDARPVSKGAALKIWRLVSRRDDVIVPLSKGSQGLPIYCVHSIGGDLSGYDKLAESFGISRSFYGIQVPRSLMNANGSPSIEAMATRYADEITRFQPFGPLVLAGYSAGAIIALEIAQQLRQSGRDVPLLVAFDGAPSNIEGLLKPWDLQYIVRLLCNIPWRVACVRLTDLSLSSLKSRNHFRRLIVGQQPREQHATIDSEAILSVLSQGEWPVEQQYFIKRIYDSMLAYVPQRYAGPVILYEVKAQPFFKLMQLAAAWRSICPTCELFKVPFTRHSDFFGSASGLRLVVEHLDTALRRLDRQT